MAVFSFGVTPNSNGNNGLMELTWSFALKNVTPMFTFSKAYCVLNPYPNLL